MESKPRNVTGKKVDHLSRALTQVLRHKAAEIGLAIRADGFCDLDEVLQSTKDLRKFEATIHDVRHVVESNNKKRLELKEVGGKMLIRAVQGHTMEAVKDEELLTKLTADSIGDKHSIYSYNQVVHGT